AQGKRVLYVQDGHIVAQEGAQQVRISLSEVPLTQNGAIGFQVENVSGVCYCYLIRKKGDSK
ncbi:MAG: hypothetical protein RIT47_803, partial [Pseudomonadota bacterium]